MHGLLNRGSVQRQCTAASARPSAANVMARPRPGWAPHHQRAADLTLLNQSPNLCSSLLYTLCRLTRSVQQEVLNRWAKRERLLRDQVVKHHISDLGVYTIVLSKHA